MAKFGAKAPALEGLLTGSERTARPNKVRCVSALR